VKAVTSSEKAPQPAARPHRSAARWWVLGAFLVAGVAGAAWGLHGSHSAGPSRHGSSPKAAQDGADSAEAVAVDVVRPSKGGITRTVTQVGSVHAFEWADLFAKVSGYLNTLRVDYGTRVKKGELLAEIFDPEAVKERDRAASAVVQAKATVRVTEAKLENAKADAKAAEAAVEQARADIDRRVAARTYRAKVLSRYRTLVAKDALTQQIVDEWEHHLESAIADERAARAALLTSEAQREAAKAKVDQAGAEVEQANANRQVDEELLAKSQVLVDYTKITSPYDGVITRRNFFPGAFIRSAEEGNTVPLLTVARTDKMRAVTWVPDLDVPFLHVGAPAEVTIDALKNQAFKGRVSRFSYVEEPTSRTMYTEIDLPNPDGRLREGMYGIAKIILGVAEHALTIPASCLVGESHGGKADVFVVKDGKAEKRHITVGANDGIRVEVLEGLGPEDQVIKSTSAVSEGTPVRARDAGVAQTEPATR
jgi:RND family efflux transporter MFP subunit